MKKVSGYISVRALGTYDYEFYVDDDVTKRRNRTESKRV